MARVEPFPFEVGRTPATSSGSETTRRSHFLHARFTRDSVGDFFLHDLESGNGTFVNEERADR